MGVSNYTPTGISHATSVDFSKRSVNQPVHIVQYDRSLPILAVSLYNNGQLYRLSADMEVSIRLGKPDRTFVYNKALGCDSTRTIVYFEITQQMSLFDGEYYPVIEIMDGERIANSSTIYLVVDRNPVQHDYIESTIEYKELINYRDEAVKAGNEAKEAAKVAKESEEATKLSETNAKDSENESVKYGNLAKSYAVGTDNTIRENDAEDNAKTYCEAAKASAGNAKQSETNAKQSETNAKTYLDKIIEKVDVVVDTAMSDTSENPVQNKVIKKYVDEHTPEVADMTGATSTQNGAHGLVPAPQMGDEKKALLGDGTWGSVDAILTYKTKEEYDTAVANDEIPDGAKVIKEYDEGDSTVIIGVDTAMSDTSENPVQNKVIKKYVDEHTPEVADMTGATADKDGTSGTVPAPKVSDKDKFLRGDGTWAEAKQDLSAYYNNAEYIDNKLQLKHDDKVLKEFEIKGSGGATITPKPTVNPQIKNDDTKVIITWEDPTDTVIDGSTFSKWAGTKLVMKESGYPTSPDDGTLLVDNTTRDKYKTTGFEKSGLTNDKQYYFALFPYSTDGVYNYDSGNRLLGEPTELKIVTFAGGTDAEIAKMIQAHYNDKINLSDYWAVGDTRSVSLSAMSATGVGESHRAQTVQFVIGDFNHDDLATPINGHTKAAVTLLQKDCLMDASNASNPVNGSGNTENGYMNSTNTNVGGWKNCARRTWCNNVYFSALPSAWQSMVKTVNKKSGTGGGSSSGTEITADKIFLAAEIEIFGSRTYSVDGEGTQYQYYKNATANIYKMPKWRSLYVSNVYWERSPLFNSNECFCVVNESGGANFNKNDYGGTKGACGIAPCLCI